MKLITGDKQMIKGINKSSILRVIQTNAPVSRADIAKTLGLTSATVSSNVKELIDDGFVKSVGSGTLSGSGRKPILLMLDDTDTGSCTIGIHIHKNGIDAALVNLLGEIIIFNQAKFKTQISLEDEVANIVDDIIKKSNHRNIIGIGIGVNGIYNPSKDIPLYIPSTNTHSYILKETIEKRFDLPVTIDNDTNAMAIGEKWYGYAKKLENYIFINIGSGIGAGIVINGQPYRGSGFAAGEIGHICVQPNGLQCICGKHGCLDTIATEYSIIQSVKNSIGRGTKSIVSDLTSGDLEKVTVDILRQAAELNDSCVLDVLKYAGQYIGMVVSYMMNVLNPQAIFLSGSVARIGDPILKYIKENALNFAMNECSDGVSIHLSALMEHADVVGPAALNIQKMLQTDILA